MIPISNAFRAELDRQIRNRGRCQIMIFWNIGGSYTIDEFYLQSVSYHLTGDPLSRSLPTEECTIVLTDYEKLWHPDNEDGLYEKAASGFAFSVRIGIETNGGSVEYTDYTFYTSKELPTWNKNTVTLHGNRELTTLTSTFKNFGVRDNNLGDLAYDVFQSHYIELGATSPAQGYNFASFLDNIAVIDHALLNDYSAKDALLAVAFAGRASVRTTHDAYVKIEDYWDRNPLKNPVVIQRDDMFSEPTVELLPHLGKEIITYYRDPASEETDTILDVEITGDIDSDDSVRFTFSRNIVPSTFDMTQMVNVKLTTFAYDVFKDNIRITTLERINTSSPAYLVAEATIADPQEATYTVDVGNFQSGQIESEEVRNPLLYHGSPYYVENWLAEYRASYINGAPGLYRIEYRGDPSIEPLDTIRVELPVVGIVPCIVVESTFEYAGGFHGILFVRRILEPTASQTTQIAVSNSAVSDEAVSDTSTA